LAADDEPYGWRFSGWYSGNNKRRPYRIEFWEFELGGSVMLKGHCLVCEGWGPRSIDESDAEERIRHSPGCVAPLAQAADRALEQERRKRRRRGA
jgi:hypothetical protein